MLINFGKQESTGNVTVIIKTILMYVATTLLQHRMKLIIMYDYNACYFLTIAMQAYLGIGPQ